MFADGLGLSLLGSRPTGRPLAPGFTSIFFTFINISHFFVLHLDFNTFSVYDRPLPLAERRPGLVMNLDLDRVAFLLLFNPAFWNVLALLGVLCMARLLEFCPADLRILGGTLLGRFIVANLPRHILALFRIFGLAFLAGRLVALLLVLGSTNLVIFCGAFLGRLLVANLTRNIGAFFRILSGALLTRHLPAFLLVLSATDLGVLGRALLGRLVVANLSRRISALLGVFCGALLVELLVAFLLVLGFALLLVGGLAQLLVLRLALPLVLCLAGGAELGLALVLELLHTHLR